MQIVPGNHIEERFRALATEVFGLSVEAYLAANHGRQLFGYAIDLPAHSFFPLFGNPPASLTEAMNRRFGDSIAGYKVAVQEVFPIAGLNADVLLLATELSVAPESDFDTILIHKLCHLVLDSNSLGLTNLTLDQKSRYSGERLYKKTDRENERITKHSVQFCTLLAAAAERYAKNSPVLSIRSAVLDSAMRYDLKSNTRT
ncbi:hypothetical protein ACQE3E_23725 (plasmid) [Methylomonas sp. MED-D]|uniref:hypothetical protein n=1 Tax=Methylomonas sp. MED-D TaxID=3418768 RepID=UPI003CFBF63E